MGLLLLPIVKGKEDAYKKFVEEMMFGSKREGFKDLNKRYQLTRHDVWYCETPGGPMAAVLHEGPGAEEFLHGFAQSTESFDVWMRELVSEFHDMDFNEPPPGPPPQKLS